MTRRKIKKKYKKILLFFIIILIIIGFSFYFLFIKSKKIYKTISIEVGENLPETSDYIDNIDTSISWQIKPSLKNGKVTKVGTYTGTIKNGLKKYKIQLIVGDTTVPIISGYKNLNTTVGSDINLLDDIIVTDNSGEKITPTVEGKYDISSSGTYELAYKACDSSGNCSSEDFTLTVKSKNSDTTLADSTSDVEMKYVDGILIVNKSFPLPADYVPDNLVSAGGSAKAIDYVVEAFNKLKADAAKENLNIYASTAYRSYDFQKTLYTNYVARDGKTAADTYSARPGYSEHQTGLAIDCNSVNDSFTDTDEGKWLNDNAWKYGFAIRFPKDKQNETGYTYESWHIRYVGEKLAKKLYNDGDWLSLEGYFNLPSEYAE